MAVTGTIYYGLCDDSSERITDAQGFDNSCLPVSVLVKFTITTSIKHLHQKRVKREWCSTPSASILEDDV
jgi:hypothetical protein